ncbi:hypothetical protein IM543_07640 [Massilia sp. UMI-21]|nr:hypothetical protein IM543_07640 [Massilia sp. UMI-21]
MLFSCALLAGAAQAAELGEPRVSSFIGQPLVADIELGMLEDAATPVQVRLAGPNVYRGANIGMPAVLSTLRMSVMRRDGRQFLHVTSLAPVASEHLHLYLELADGAQRSVRLATLWLLPDPDRAPAPAPAPVPAPVPVSVPVPGPGPAPVVARAEAPQPMPNQEPAPKPVVKRQRASRPVAARPTPALPKPVEPAPAGGACAPQARQQVDACVVLGAKNALLREQLGQLEDKLRVLQVAAGAAPAALMQPAVMPKGAMSSQVHRPKKKKPEPPAEESSPWLMAGAIAGVLALLAGLLVALRRGKGPQRATAPHAGLGARLKARLGRKPAPAATVEPRLEEGAHNSSTQA